MIRVDDVRFAAELATQLTGGVFELADARLGKEGRAHTWIYVDRRRPLVWRGRHGSIRAAGYYLGVAQAVTDLTGEPLPDRAHALIAEIHATHLGPISEQQGRDDYAAELRLWRRMRPDEPFPT